MSNLRFQMQNVGGKPQIFFGSEKDDKNTRKFGYKKREQRFPLREKIPVEEPQPVKPKARPGVAGRQPAGGAVGQKRLTLGSGKKAGPSPAAGGTVTLTQDQLELILNSVGKTAAADRDNSVRISVERTDGGLSIEAEASPRRGIRRRPDSDDDDSALGETADTGGSDEEDRGRRRKAVPAPPRAKGGGENVLGLLAKAETKPKGRQRVVQVERKKEEKKEKERKEKKKEVRKEEDMDQKMQRLIAENKGKMSEAELVDLLAAVYMEERKKQLDGGEAKEKGDRRRQRGEEEERRAPVRRRPVIRDDDSDSERNRPRNKRRPQRHRDDSDEDRLDLDSEDDERHRRRGNRSRDPPRRRRPPSESEEEELVPKSRVKKELKKGRRRATPPESEEEKEKEVKESGRTTLEAPKFLTIAEKKRLQWEKEREELKNLKTYDPWGRPGAGAPPKEDASPPMLSKKEEEQQRYARELSDQLKEKREMEQRDQRRRYDGGGAPGDGLMNVDADALQLSGSFARGRGMANLDEKTRSDLEEQRKRQVEHQEAIKKQVEERQAKRAQERERRIREEQEEEARLQRERDRLQRQFDDEQTRSRKREVEHEARLAQLQAANEAAEQSAKMEKARRRMERLEGGGHDTSGLRANLEAELTARGQPLPLDMGQGLARPSDVQLTTYTRAQVPGLEGIAEVESNMLDRWATPRSVHFPPSQPAPLLTLPDRKEDLQVQTDPALLQPLLQHAIELAAAAHASTAHAQEQPVRKKERQPPSQAPTQRTTTRKVAPKFQRGHVVAPEKPPLGRSRHPVPVNQRPKWGASNTDGRKTLKQSERDVSDWKRQDREQRRAKREAELMAKVEMNQHRIPKHRAGPPSTRRMSDSGPTPNFQEAPVYMGTYNLEAPEPAADSWRAGPVQPSGRISPPVPTLRRKGGAHAGPTGMSRSEENLAAVGRNDDFGLVRTSEVLNPAKAERPLPLSREDTERQLARKTYLKGLNPAHYGNYMANLDDHRMEHDMPHKTTNSKNPIFNPGIVKDMPTPRQDAILQHLSDIRKNLLQKQKEIETSLSLGDSLV